MAPKRTSHYRKNNIDENKYSEWSKAGCILSALLFTPYTEEIFKETPGELREGLVVNGIVINNIRFADNSALFAGSAEDLQTLIDRAVTTSKKYGLGQKS